MAPGSVFISHSSREPDFATTRALAETLAGAKLDVWWDQAGLEGGGDFSADILEAIIRQANFVFVLSEHSAASPWCRRELARAAELGKPLIPLRLDDIPAQQVPLELSGAQYIDLRQGVPDALPNLLRALGLGLGPQYDADSDPFARDGRLVRAVAQGLRHGTTFTNARNLVILLSNLGQQCAETDRARELFGSMTQRRGDFRTIAHGLLMDWNAE